MHRSPKKIILFILLILIIDLGIGIFIIKSRSFPRLALWNIIESSDTSLFYWPPQQAPEYFYFDSDDRNLEPFRKDLSGLIGDSQSDLNIGLAVSNYILNLKKDSPYTGKRMRWESPQKMLQQLKKGELGSCFNDAVIFSAYLSSLGIISRLWALEGDDGLGRFGHTVAEVFVKDLDKWVMVDVSKNIIFEKNGLPLSVLELRKEFLNNNSSQLEIESNLSPYLNRGYLLGRYQRLLKMVFLRSANDYIYKYDPKIRYKKLYKLEKIFDKMPSITRRGLSYLLGRKEYLIHYLDEFESPLKHKIILAKSLFYFFFLSLCLIGAYLFALLIRILKDQKNCRPSR